jgi:hypothetical protein
MHSRLRPSPAMVIALIALFVSLGGTAAALSGSNTVFSDDIVDNQVYSADVRNDTLTGGGLAAPDLRPGSVGTSEVATNSLNGGDINELNLDLSLIQRRVDGTCSAGSSIRQIAQDGTVSCEDDDDTNSGGTVTQVDSGSGLTGGPITSTGALDVGAGTGISVSANSIDLDTTFTDSRYVNEIDTTTGCPAGYLRVNALCWENIDDSGFTFAQASNKCRVEGGRLPSYDEMLGVMQSGVTLGNGGPVEDWLGDATGTNLALRVTNNTTGEATEESTSNSRFARCVIELRPKFGYGP